MALASPGVEVTIVDESQYLPSAPASVPLILVATAQNKANSSGTGIAVATTAANANKLYRVTSQRDLVNLYGNPFFYKTTNGTSLQGYELNEYGLLAAYSVLGSTNLCYVLRADIDLASLVGRTGRPAGAPPNGTYWLDTASSTFGIFEFNQATGAFTSKTPIIINDSADLKGGMDGNGSPIDSIGNIGDYAVTFRTDSSNRTDSTGAPSTYSTHWFKNKENSWVALGGDEWKMNWPVLQGTKSNPTLVTGNKFMVNGEVVTLTGTTLAMAVSAINAKSFRGVDADVVDGRLILTSTMDSVEITAYRKSIASIARIGNTVTVNTTGLHDLSTGDSVVISNVVSSSTSFNGTFTVTVVDNDTFTYSQTGTSEGGTATNASVTLTGTPLVDMGISEGIYNPPVLTYGTNAQQPTWRVTDSSPRPTGSVWVKTNSSNRGTSLVVSQYNAASATFAPKSVSLYTSDESATNALDPLGGINIPLNAVYAKYGENMPMQFFRRVAVGPAIFAGSAANPTFATGEFDVYVSTPGSSALSGPYTVSLSAGDNAVNFVQAWFAANIPNTTAQVSASNSIILTHLSGGTIILDDYGVSSSPVTTAGFVVNANTSLAKWGPYKEVTYTNVGVDASSLGGDDAKFTVTVNGYNVTFSVTTPGTNYSVGMILTLPTGAAGAETNYRVKVTGVNESNGITSVQWYEGAPVPKYSVQLSNWQPLNWIPNSISPTVYPASGTLWYYSVVNQVDILTNVGGVWKSYRKSAFASNGLPAQPTTSNPMGQTDSNGPILSATPPSAATGQTDGTPLVYGDLWIDTSDLENYPMIYRWKNVNGADQWVNIDNTDQTTENGIVFADARWGGSGSVDPVYDALPSVISLLTNQTGAGTAGDPYRAYVDLDAPLAANYPQGTLLFNTRRSGYNIKQYVENYFNAGDFPDSDLPQETSAWVTVSGNETSGAPYMGRKAQRAMVVKAMKASLDTNTTAREEDTFFNLLSCPNYPELQSNLIALNNDRNQTAYIIGDTPMRLPDDANAIVDWATNASGATGTGEDGLVTRDVYMGLYYPSGITTDLTGTEVAVPASHMIMRTMVYNDTVAYPWFAPAGQRRGIIDNASNIGYINSTTGEFVTTKNRMSLRDIQYANFINPLAYFTNIGLLNFGNKNSFNSQSALDRTNVSRLLCYIRWNLQSALRPFIFEPNDTITRGQARSVVQTLLADIQSKRGIYDYLVVCDESNNTPARIDANELWIDVAIEPVKAAEFIYVPVRILNTGEIAGLGSNG